MSLSPAPADIACPAITRLSALVALDGRANAILADALRRRTPVPARRELMIEGQEIRQPQLILRGWAARVRHLADGRRQIVAFVLPGDLLGLCDPPATIATTSVVAVTDMVVCTPPRRGASPLLDKVYAISKALDEAYLVAQVTRVGQLDAYERLGDFLLELLERLQLAGLAADGGFILPMTQEMLADTLGLTSVHINRTLQAMRRENSIVLKNRVLRFTNAEALRRGLGRLPVRVCATR
jgi:CRP-like cAMP-binding protein